jgi:hypothetical protein
MSATHRVDIDTSKLEADSKRLAVDIKRDVNPAADKTASTVASRLIALVPVDTGALRDSVRDASINDGAEVHYGGGLTYARLVAHRTGCTDRALTNADQMFQEAMRRVAAAGVRKV